MKSPLLATHEGDVPALCASDDCCDSRLSSSPEVRLVPVHELGLVVCRDAHESLLSRRTEVAVHGVPDGNDCPALVAGSLEEDLDLTPVEGAWHAQNAFQ